MAKLQHAMMMESRMTLVPTASLERALYTGRKN
jgi:hypothetical protein